MFRLSIGHVQHETATINMSSAEKKRKVLGKEKEINPMGEKEKVNSSEPQLYCTALERQWCLTVRHL